MGTKRLVYAGGPVAFVLRAGYADVTLKTDENATASSVTLTGDQKTLDEVTEDRGQGSWAIRIPNQGGGSTTQINSFSSDGSLTQTVVAGGRSTVIQTDGDMDFGGVQIGNMTIGRIRGARGVTIQSGGRTVVNGVDVTDYVKEKGGRVESALLKAEIVLPHGSAVGLDITDGSVALDGDMEVKAETRNAPVTAMGLTSGMIKTRNADIRVESALGVTLETHNANISLGDARGQTMATSHNGDVRVHVTASVQVMASTHNGDVTVTKAPGTEPMVMASSHNGRVRKP